MKTLEDLNLMGVEALKGIHLQLTGNKPKSGLSKSQLAQLVYDLQQPDAPTEEQKSDNGATGGEETNTQNAESLTVGDENEPAGAAVDPNSPDFLSVDEGSDADDLIGEAPATPEPVLPAKHVFAHTNEQARVQDVEKALRHLPIHVAVDEDGVTLTKGGKRIFTTIKQPLHRIVATAETFARG